MISVEENLLGLKLQHKARQSAKHGITYGMLEGKEIFYQRMFYLNPQSYGGRLEKYIMLRMNLKKVKGDGDAVDTAGNIYEIKGSMSAEGTFNMVQIREHHSIDYYLIICIELIPEDNFRVVEHIFCLPSTKIKEIKTEIAHGRVDNTSNNKTLERRTTFHKGDDLWVMLQEYRIDVKELN